MACPTAALTLAGTMPWHPPLPRGLAGLFIWVIKRATERGWAKHETKRNTAVLTHFNWAPSIGWLALKFSTRTLFLKDFFRRRQGPGLLRYCGLPTPGSRPAVVRRRDWDPGVAGAARLRSLTNLGTRTLPPSPSLLWGSDRVDAEASRALGWSTNSGRSAGPSTLRSHSVQKLGFRPSKVRFSSCGRELKYVCRLTHRGFTLDNFPASLPLALHCSCVSPELPSDIWCCCELTMN